MIGTKGGQELADRISAGLAAPVRDEIRAFAQRLGRSHDALAVLFYGSNLRSGSLEGVLDFYVLTDGPREKGLWPRVAYHEMEIGGETLRAKVAVMRLSTFRHAAQGRHADTTIWARFVQPCALAWAIDGAGDRMREAIASACQTAARFAAALGPGKGTERDFWGALFRATYRAELRVEKPGRELQILDFGAEHFDGLLPAAWSAAGIGFDADDGMLSPQLLATERAALIRRWENRRRMGKPLNVVRLLRAGTTFEGGARYLAWKVERHSGIKVPLTPFRERHPLICAPVLVSAYWREKRRRQKGA
ncbi:hypothetical protein [Croceicoccus mobilis]|uniref:Phosphatidate cytidylyltransferase n=1 Tax=Croceicoccus mobilis TaxID=1703339 RepID=A0A916YRY4_9SPHN|nr:hypothetical protein [Croceicoccus mobilis]GGD56859.1 hypothetical protein GCM10010990_02570 [Croceicoccus mobilis]